MKEETETDVPYTLTQVEDAMYLDEATIVTLEYYYFQSDCKYTVLQPLIERIDPATGKLVDERGEIVSNGLGTSEYQPNSEAPHPMSTFDRKDIINYNDDGTTLFQKNRSADNENWYQEVEHTKKAGQEAVKVEGVLALYGVSNKGGMYRISQTHLSFPKKYVQASNDGNMKLTRSTDKKVFSLTRFDPNDSNGEYFHIKAWYSRLRPFQISDKLNIGMNKFFDSIKENFSELVSVKFVGNCNYVLLTYIETALTSSEKKTVQAEHICSNLKTSLGDLISKAPKQSIGVDPKRHLNLRKGIRYVFFNAETGRQVLSQNFREKAMSIKVNHNEQQKTIKIYKLQLMVKETRENPFNPSLIIFYAGDFMDSRIKRNMRFRWALGTVNIALSRIISMKEEQQNEFIEQSIQLQIHQQKNLDQINYIPFDQSWIEQQPLAYSVNIKIAANSGFDRYAIINQPAQEKGSKKISPLIYVNGPFYRASCNPNSNDGQEVCFKIPYFRQYPGDIILKHARNSNIKDYICYQIIKNCEEKTIYLDDPQCASCHAEPTPICIKIPITHYRTEPEPWRHTITYTPVHGSDIKEEQDVFQVLSVTHNDCYALLQTRFPIIRKATRNSDFSLYARRSNQFCQRMTNYPCIAYNLGESKLAIINTNNVDGIKSYILNMQQDEKFVCFVDFNQFEDIGFYPRHLRIECCAYFFFLTTSKKQGLTDETIETCCNKFNLFIIDSFNRVLQCCLFRSSAVFDNEIFNQKDFIVRSLIQSTMEMKRDLNFKTYMWTQFPDNLVRSSMLRITYRDEKGEDVQYEIDSDNEIQDELRQEMLLDQQEELDQNDINSYESVPITLNDKDFIFYILKKQGQLFIMEGNPKDQYVNKHYAIFNIKVDKCLGFQVVEDTFYFMDEHIRIYVLTRNENNRELHVAKELTMKEIQKMDFKVQPFEHTIFNDHYVIQGNKIFYLYETIEGPHPQGILESEDLIAEDKNQKNSYLYIQGPNVIKGSNKYFNVYCEKDKSLDNPKRSRNFRAKIHIFRLPDNAQKILINDYSNQVDMSTFIFDGKVLVKIRRRFMVFDAKGDFIDEVEFNDGPLEQAVIEDNEQTIFAKSARQQKNLVPDYISNLNRGRCRTDEQDFLDFEGNNYPMKKAEPREPIMEANKMELLQMSYNNKKFLFFNRKLEKMFIYDLVEIVQPANPKAFHSSIAGKRYSYQFVMSYEILINECGPFYRLRDNGIDILTFFRKNNQQIIVDNTGSVKICFVENTSLRSSKAFPDDVEDD